MKNYSICAVKHLLSVNGGTNNNEYQKYVAKIWICRKIYVYLQRRFSGYSFCLAEIDYIHKKALLTL